MQSVKPIWCNTMKQESFFSNMYLVYHSFELNGKLKVSAKGLGCFIRSEMSSDSLVVQ